MSKVDITWKGLFYCFVLKGPNASGKTQAIKGLAFLAHFCTKSFSDSPENAVGVSAFYESKKPCELYAEFSIDGIVYLYELSATEKEVKKETIFRTKSKKTKILERTDNELTYLAKDLKGLSSIKLRKNVSVISTANQYELKELADLYYFFRCIISNVGQGGLIEKGKNISEISKYLLNNNDEFKFVKKIISGCDNGVVDITIEKVEIDGVETEYFPVFYHESNGKTHRITHHQESSGTKALFRELARYKVILDLGGVLALDEFDLHLHPHILPKLLQLFMDKKTNKKDAQIVFTTHDTRVLDLLGRYRTYLINKTDNESFAYRLDEVPGDILRNDRSITPAYNDGKIGGVPRV